MPPVVRSGLNGWRMNLDTGAAVNTFRLNLPVVNGFQMVELGSFKDTTKTDCSDL